MRKSIIRQAFTIAWLIALLTMMPAAAPATTAQAASRQGNADTAAWRAAIARNRQPGSLKTNQVGNTGSPQAQMPALAGDSAWDIRFVNGVSNGGYASNVYAVASTGSDVYIGGSFSMAGGIAANNIARWSTSDQQWHTLGGGINGIIYSIVPHGNFIYVGGSFNDIGGASAWSLARWDTTAQSWSLVGGQPGLVSGGKFVGVVNAMAFDSSGDLYVGGYFDSAGSVAVKNIARWDGVSWSALGGGLGATSSEGVYSLVVSGADVYAGGLFSTPENNIAHWNGASWSGMGGTNGKVSALTQAGSDLYAGGQFTMAGSTPAQHIALWNGSSWQDVAGGTDGEVTAIVPGLAGYFVTGSFQNAGSLSASNFARWDGSTWSTLGDGADGETYAATMLGNRLFIGGAFINAGFQPSNHVALWDFTLDGWHTLGNSVDAAIYAIAIRGNDVYIGGRFNSAGGIPVHNLAKWNRQTGEWSDVGGGVQGCNGSNQACTTAVWAIAINGTSVYIGGNFTDAGVLSGQVKALSLARWDTVSQEWTGGNVGGDCGLACENDVLALVPDGSGVDAGGGFSNACSASCDTVNNVVYWDGNTTYHPFTDGFTTGTDGAVSALLNDGSGLYIGGLFSSPRTNLAYFDGNNFFGPGSALNNYITALAEDGQYLYAGGAFTNAGGSGADKLARLSLTGSGDWQPLGGAFDDFVSTLAFSGSDLIAGGAFTQNNLASLEHIARWNTVTQTWSPLGSGANGYVLGIATAGGEIFAGGRFTSMGGKEADYFARWAQYDTFIPLLQR